MKDLHETDDLRILDYNGEQAFRLFRLSDLGRPILHEPVVVGRSDEISLVPRRRYLRL